MAFSGHSDEHHPTAATDSLRWGPNPRTSGVSSGTACTAAPSIHTNHSVNPAGSSAPLPTRSVQISICS